MSTRAISVAHISSATADSVASPKTAIPASGGRCAPASRMATAGTASATATATRTAATRADIVTSSLTRTAATPVGIEPAGRGGPTRGESPRFGGEPGLRCGPGRAAGSGPGLDQPPRRSPPGPGRVGTAATDACPPARAGEERWAANPISPYLSTANRGTGTPIWRTRRGGVTFSLGRAPGEPGG